MLPENHHDSRAETAQRARHCSAHEKKLEKRCWCKETSVGPRVSEKAHGLGSDVHRFAKVAEYARIVRTVVGRIKSSGARSGTSFRTMDRGKSFFARMFVKTK